MDYQIVKAAPEDLDALRAAFDAYARELEGFGIPYQFHAERLEDVLRGRIRSGMCFVPLVKTENSALAAFLIASVVRLSGEYLSEGGSTIGYVNHVYVRPEHRRRGLAERLLAETETWLRGAGVRSLTLDVLGRNEGAQRLYAAAGFRPTAITLYKSLT